MFIPLDSKISFTPYVLSPKTLRYSEDSGNFMPINVILFSSQILIIFKSICFKLEEPSLDGNCSITLSSASLILLLLSISAQLPVVA
jgi:hypothetical protein